MKESFSEMRSETYSPEYIARIRWSIVILFAVIAVVLLGFFIDAVSHTSTDTASDMIFFLFFLITGLLAGWLAYQMIRNQDEKISGLLINHQGILFLNRKEKILSEIKYQDLIKSKDSYTKDIYSESQNLGKYSNFRKNLYVHEKDETGKPKKKLINLDVIPLKNRYDLIGHFLKGVQTFRPDLKIDSEVYKDFYLDEKTLRYAPDHLKSDMKVKIITIAVVILVIIAFRYIFLDEV
ncbi:hypothetical protein KYG33_01590 [Chryseobacterium sp. D764]|jgi:hypothetical protein|uniref:hypothetical protein n=1 Tax=unclassified Chryseobacterium TaxID=2593645 RepID=UPI0009860023|nr:MULTISPECIES: hypothetical protein [unclassified Chryseobacterium]QXU49766.1 hypothetical protein KYG33_01590 [Chryseobacterium sp. D764]CAD0225841.1 conserved membrane protein of unknown function [Chryseobacterium sp. JV274]